ncbi:hypothetical protein V500_06366 [Pseudogymnoascus sp. VKM F-4518 (FW-2643)]|nr:hypothetical protein V500_06366 [Pseudogymnoascus sp. VKM F-4518 (FW-2643)]
MWNRLTVAGFIVATATASISDSCPDYLDYAKEYHAPYSAGKYNLSSQRPAPSCRTFESQDVEDTIDRMNKTMRDPDLFQLFQNAFPNTLDTAIKWHGTAEGSDEELTFVITGDINAMWLRDSANQMQSYLPLLKPATSSNSIASLYRGVINLQARYLLTSPYCNSFQPPVESGIPPAENGASTDDRVFPTYTNQSVFECKYELDSLAAFLEVSSNYYKATNDIDFFKKYKWVDAINAILDVATTMMEPTYNENGSVNTSPYTFTRQTNRATETFANDGFGNPSAPNTGLIRSGFRPSDDATIYQFLIPSNMMFASYLASTAEIMSALPGHKSLGNRMAQMAVSLRESINKHGIVNDPVHGRIYAFEVDGYGSRNIMDDSNVPSLLSAPFIGFVDRKNKVYQNTRKVILSTANPYFMKGPVFNSIGGPHVGPGYGWPMASIIRIMTSDDDAEIKQTLGELLFTTDGLGLMHEGINSFDSSKWTRQWFSWVNGLFGQMILDLEERKPYILKTSFQ